VNLYSLDLMHTNPVKLSRLADDVCVLWKVVLRHFQMALWAELCAKMMTGLKIRHCNRLLDHIGVKIVLKLLLIEFTINKKLIMRILKSTETLILVWFCPWNMKREYSHLNAPKTKKQPLKSRARNMCKIFSLVTGFFEGMRENTLQIFQALDIL
jgi:hypothetical protein